MKEKVKEEKERLGWRHAKAKVDEFYKDNSNTKSTKANFLGYCPSCNVLICDLDLVSPRKILCPSCGNECKLNALNKESKVQKKWRNKKEYLEGTVLIAHSDFDTADIPTELDADTPAKSTDIDLIDPIDD